MFRSFLDNLSSLILAFLLALMVWMVAVNQGQGPPVPIEFPKDGLSIETINLPPGLVIAGQPTKSVMVKLRAPESNINRLTESDLRAYVDLRGLSPGLHEVPVVVTCTQCSVNRVNVLRWEPDQISIKLEDMVEQAVPVKPSLQGSTAVGYQAEQPTAEPEEVVVSGPRSLVERVSAVRTDIYLFNENATVEKEVSLVAVDADGNVVTGVDLDPRRVTVTVPIVPEGQRKEVAVTPVISGTVASGYYASGISVDPQTVVLAGSRSRIQEAPGYVETEPVSIVGAQAPVTVQVRVLLPEGVRLVDPTHQMVTVRVQISPFMGGRTFEVTPRIENLGPGLVAKVSPPQLQVFLSGPVPNLEALQASGVQVVLDLTDRQPGRHRIEPMVLVTQELLETRTLPEVVEVTISVKATPTPEVTETLHSVR